MKQIDYRKIIAQKSANLSEWGVQTQAFPPGAGIQPEHSVRPSEEPSNQSPVLHPSSKGMGTILLIRYKAVLLHPVTDGIVLGLAVCFHVEKPSRLQSLTSALDVR